MWLYPRRAAAVPSSGVRAVRCSLRCAPPQSARPRASWGARARCVALVRSSPRLRQSAVSYPPVAGLTLAGCRTHSGIARRLCACVGLWGFVAQGSVYQSIPAGCPHRAGSRHVAQSAVGAAVFAPMVVGLALTTERPKMVGGVVPMGIGLALHRTSDDSERCRAYGHRFGTPPNVR